MNQSLVNPWIPLSILSNPLLCNTSLTAQGIFLWGTEENKMNILPNAEHYIIYTYRGLKDIKKVCTTVALGGIFLVKFHRSTCKHDSSAAIQGYFNLSKLYSIHLAKHKCWYTISTIQVLHYPSKHILKQGAFTLGVGLMLLYWTLL